MKVTILGARGSIPTEGSEMLEFGGAKPTLRHNHDRKLEEIINRHCFKQLDEFNKKKSL